MIEDHYFEQGNLETRPGTSRYETVTVDRFEPNGYGLYNMHSNVGEWVWDLYGEYGADGQNGTVSMTRHSEYPDQAYRFG